MKPFGRFVLFVLAMLGCFAFGFSWRNIQRGELPTSQPVKKLLQMDGKTEAVSPEQVFKRTFNSILSSYYRPVQAKDLKYAGISGLVSSLGDPHTLFMVPDLAHKFSDETKANFVGVGARLNPDPLGAKVFMVFEDGPAFAAGLREGDLITTVDGKAVGGVDIDSIIEKIRGKEGTIVKLTVIHQGNPKPAVLEVHRRKIIAPTVDTQFLADSKIGIISVASFSEPTATQFDAGLDKIDRQGPRGLIIDLRNNPGGLLEIAKDMLARFFENKTVVTMRFRDGHVETERTYGGYKREWGYPVVVLVNSDSASAAEIFTGALRDYKLATVVGEHTYGKASVQNVFPLIDSSSAKITIARYYLPSQKDIGRKVDEYGQYISGGIEPDVQVKFDGDNEKVKFGDPKSDNQLIKAIEVVKSKM